MHITIAKAARRIRHLPGVEKFEWLWNALRPAYHRLASAGSDGVPFSIGGQIVRIPAKFASNDWDHYEPETAQAVAHWSHAHPGGLFLDVGSSIGIFCAVAELAGRDIECIAFDSDLSSLATVRRLCPSARLVHGFVVDHGCGLTINDAELTSEPKTQDSPAFRNFEGGDTDVPRNALQDLFREYPERGRPVLLKSDIEGAELFMLRGAGEFIRRCNPTILVSVHRLHLPLYGHTPEDVMQFLDRYGYTVEVLAVDHEEHWLCRPSKSDVG